MTARVTTTGVPRRMPPDVEVPLLRTAQEALANVAKHGVAAGITGTAVCVYAHARGWATVIPVQAWAGDLASALLIGAAAGLIPALKAARLSPTQALWSI